MSGKLFLIIALLATPICIHAQDPRSISRIDRSIRTPRRDTTSMNATTTGPYDTTYLRLDGTNSGSLMAIGQVKYAAAYSGANFGAQVSAAIAALGQNPGTVDATSLTGSQSMSATITVPNGVTVLLGSGLTLTSSVCPVFYLQDASNVLGAGAWENSGVGTYITTNSPNCNAIHTGIFSRVERLTIDNTALTNSNSSGIYSSGGGDNNVRFVRIVNFSTAVNVPQDYYDVFEGIQAVTCNYGGYFGGPSTSNIWILGNVQCGAAQISGFYLGGSGITLINPDVENSGGSFGIGYDIAGASNTLIAPYFENVVTGIQLEAGAVQNYIEGGTNGGVGSAFVPAAGADPTQNSINVSGAGGHDGMLFPQSSVTTATVLDFDDSVGNSLLRFQHDTDPVTGLCLVWGPQAPSPPYTPGRLAPLNVGRLSAAQIYGGVQIYQQVSGQVIMDLTQGEMQQFQLNGNVTLFSFANPMNGERATVEVFQCYPGNNSWQWAGNIRGGMAINTGSGRTSVQSFQYDGTNWVAISPGFSF